jgi:hypothetical protein
MKHPKPGVQGLLAYIENHVERDPSGCVLWRGPTNGREGLGQPRARIRSSGVRWSISPARLLFERAHGPFPPDVHLRHTCGRSNCVNVDHLEAPGMATAEPEKRSGEHELPCPTKGRLAEWLTAAAVEVDDPNEPEMLDRALTLIKAAEALGQTRLTRSLRSGFEARVQLLEVTA